MRYKVFLQSFILYFIFFMCLSLSASVGNDCLLDRRAPFFKVVSGDKKTLTLEDIKGKVVVLFYESKNTIEQNRVLKDALNLFYSQQPEPVKKEIVRLGVINCRGILFRGAWEAALRDHSAKEGITVYGDWDGKMSVDYHTEDAGTHVFIIDKKGFLRYCVPGRVEDKDIAAVERLLNVLILEND